MTICAKIIADSISFYPYSIRLTTLQLRYPRFIHAEVMTHRVFSRNASSSRAVPVEKLIQDVLDDPVYPSFWGKNKPGMQADEECNEFIDYIGNIGLTREAAWDLTRSFVIETARKYAKAGYHKQIVNRLLEPFAHINVLVTSTDWTNFFALRDHEDAQPEIRILAKAMKQELQDSIPSVLKEGEWHLPYITYDDHAELSDLVKISVARCARVSYLTHDYKASTIEDDLKLYNRLLGSSPIHASPAEHQATPDTSWSGHYYQPWSSMDGWKWPHLHGNLFGWCQYRKTLENEYVTDR